MVEEPPAATPVAPDRLLAGAPATTAATGTDAVVTRRGRLDFLDGLRGIAALTVAVQHLGETQWVGLLGWSHQWFRAGEFAVLLFFLCSGFIIPASLERRNDLTEFWIGRFFRLWPLYTAVLAAALLAYGVSERLAPPIGFRPTTDSLLNLTMLQVFTTRPLVIGASWTLGYELVFYLLVSVLFLLGLHRSSTATATALLLCSLGLGGVTTLYMLQLRPEQWYTFPLAGLLLLLVAVATRIHRPSAKVVAVAMGLVVVVAVSNRPHPMYFSLLLLGSMFVGTVLYRWIAGQTSGRTAAQVFGLALVVILLTQRSWHIGYTEPISGATPMWWTEVVTFLAAYLVFGGALMLRHKAWTRLLTYLGTISYSVYLLHALVLIVFPRVPGGPWGNFLAMMAATVLGSVVTYNLIERPSIAVGRKVTDARRRRRAAAAAAAEPGERSPATAGATGG